MARQAAEAESELELALMTFERLLPTPLRVKQRAALERVTAAAIAVGAARTPAALLNISAKAASGQNKPTTQAFWARGGKFNLLKGVTNEILLKIASFLPSADDLLRLGLSCIQLGARSVRSNSGATTGAAAQQPLELLSIVEEAAHRWRLKCSDQERGWVPRRGRESWLGLMQELQRLQLPLAFADPALTMRQGSTNLCCWDPDGRRRNQKSSAAGLRGVGLGICSGAPMRAGVHEAHIKVHSLVGNGHGSDPDYSNWSAVGCVSAARPRPTDMDIDDGCKESIGRTEHGWAWDACGTLHVMSHLFNLQFGNN